jgi:DNA-binding NarL/FixJ family response regulator
MPAGMRLWVVADTVEDARRLARMFSGSEAFTVQRSVLGRGTEDVFPVSADLVIVQSDDPTVAGKISARRPQVPVLELDPAAGSIRPSMGMHARLPNTATPVEIRAAATALTAGLEIGAPGPSGSASESEFNLLEPLTERELEVLNLLAEGLSNPAIASELGVSRNTVKFHVSSIIQKLGAASRTEAVTAGLKRGLIII